MLCPVQMLGAVIRIRQARQSNSAVILRSEARKDLSFFRPDAPKHNQKEILQARAAFRSGVRTPMESTGLPRPEITARLTDTSSWMAKYRQARSPGVAVLRPYGNLVAHDPRWFPKLLTLNSRLRTSPMVTVTSGPE